MRIRRMTPGDLSFAVALTDVEDWAYVEEDFERLLDYEPQGCFIAETDEKRIGLTTSTSFGSVAWIGNVVVDREFRESGVGARLVEAAIEYLTGIGVKSIQLTSYMNTVGFYEELGFRQEFPVSAVSVETAGFESSDVDMVEEAELESIAALDAAHFGGDRSRVIRRMWNDFPHLLLKTDAPDGYVLATCTEKCCEIGPLIVESGDRGTAERLLRGILHSVMAAKARMFVPRASPRPFEVVRSLGFEEEYRTVRMVHGEMNRAERTEGIFALGALEKG
jgi:GNAT superfamily N-acetyltransferase